MVSVAAAAAAVFKLPGSGDIYKLWREFTGPNNGFFMNAAKRSPFLGIEVCQWIR